MMGARDLGRERACLFPLGKYMDSRNRRLKSKKEKIRLLAASIKVVNVGAPDMPLDAEKLHRCQRSLPRSLVNFHGEET